MIRQLEAQAIPQSNAHPDADGLDGVRIQLAKRQRLLQPMKGENMVIVTDEDERAWGKGKKGKGKGKFKDWGYKQDPKPYVDMTGMPGPNGEDETSGRWVYESKGVCGKMRWRFRSWKEGCGPEKMTIDGEEGIVMPLMPIEPEPATGSDDSVGGEEVKKRKPQEFIEVNGMMLPKPCVDMSGKLGPNSENQAMGRWIYEMNESIGQTWWKWAPWKPGEMIEEKAPGMAKEAERQADAASSRNCSASEFERRRQERQEQKELLETQLKLQVTASALMEQMQQMQKLDPSGGMAGMMQNMMNGGAVPRPEDMMARMASASSGGCGGGGCYGGTGGGGTWKGKGKGKGDGKGKSKGKGKGSKEWTNSGNPWGNTTLASWGKPAYHF